MVMVTITRTQNRYDHRLRQLVRTTQDVSYAVECGVPRSTARGWLSVPKGLDQGVPTVLTDGAIENFNGAVDELINSGLLRRVLAGTEKEVKG